MSGPVLVEFRLPLPLDVAGTLMELVGIAWPDAAVRTDGRPGMMTMSIPDAARRTKPLPKRRIKAARVDADAAADETLVQGVTEQDGQIALDITTPQGAWAMLAAFAATILDNDDGAPNYIEQQATTEDGRAFVVIAARGHTQTPHALRMAAEKRYDDLVAAVGAQASELGTRAQAFNGSGIGDAYINAESLVRALLPTPQTPAAPGPGKR